jgi:glyoxylate reductase
VSASTRATSPSRPACAWSPRARSGVDNIDVDAASARGIAVANTPDVLTDATADFTLALLLACARRLREGEALVRSGQWTGWEPTQLLGLELRGATLAIVGAGRIGTAVARRAEAFGMRVVSVGRGDPLGPALAVADVISLHCPLTAATRGLIDAAALAAMKPGAILLNTARGGIVDEDALVDALERGHLAAAGLDVFAGEPTVSPRVRASERVVLAPHLGSATTATRSAMAELCVTAVREVLAGRAPANLVDPSMWPRRRQAARA